MNQEKKDRQNEDLSQNTRQDSTEKTTDPQKQMEGPVSSTMHQTGEAFDTSETREEADRKKDENT